MTAAMRPATSSAILACSARFWTLALSACASDMLLLTHSSLRVASARSDRIRSGVCTTSFDSRRSSAFSSLRAMDRFAIWSCSSFADFLRRYVSCRMEVWILFCWTISASICAIGGGVREG